MHDLKMKKLEDYDVLLMIDQKTGHIFPFSAHGFEVASGSLSKLRSRTRDAVFLTADGKVTEITSIEREPTSLMARIGLLFGAPYSISVTLTQSAMPLDQLREMLIAGAALYKAQSSEEDEEWSLVRMPMTDFEAGVAGAESAKSLYDLVDLPEAIDCLDLL